MHLENFTEGWSPVHVGFEGAALSIGGINPWLHVHGWKRVQQDCIVVPHPAYRQERHRAWVYEVTSNGKTTRFAASELSNGVWGFYVPCNDAAQPVAQADLRQLRWLVRLAPTLGQKHRNMSTSKRPVAVLLAVLSIVAFGLMVLPKPKLYQGKTVRQWVALLDTHVDNQKQREGASSVLVQIGVAALLDLEPILAWRPGIWENVRSYGVQFGFAKPREVNPSELQSRACEAAYSLAEQAHVDIGRLVPHLLYHFTNGTYADSSGGRALANAGPAGITALTNLLYSGGRTVRDNAGAALGHACRRPEVIEALVRSATSEPDPVLRANAVLYLRDSGAPAQQVVPLGLSFLKSDDGYQRWAAASLLLQYRADPEARAALASTISDADQRVRSVGERALKQSAAGAANRE